MNMTRAILERVAEVELEITPEFQKEPEGTGVDAMVMHNAFSASGWNLVKAQHSEQMKTTTNSYEHPGIPGAAMRFTYRTGTGKVVGQMLVTYGAGSEPELFDPDPDMVKKLTDDWLGIEAKVDGEDKAPEMKIVTIIHMLVDLNWITTSDTVVFAGAGRKARVFQHPKVFKKIRVVYEPKTGAIVVAMVLDVDDSIVVSIMPPSSANIHETAQELMKEAGA